MRFTVKEDRHAGKGTKKVAEFALDLAKFFGKSGVNVTRSVRLPKSKLGSGAELKLSVNSRFGLRADEVGLKVKHSVSAETVQHPQPAGQQLASLFPVHAAGNSRLRDIDDDDSSSSAESENMFDIRGETEQGLEINDNVASKFFADQKGNKGVAEEREKLVTKSDEHDNWTERPDGEGAERKDQPAIPISKSSSPVDNKLPRTPPPAAEPPELHKMKLVAEPDPVRPAAAVPAESAAVPMQTEERTTESAPSSHAKTPAIPPGLPRHSAYTGGTASRSSSRASVAEGAGAQSPAAEAEAASPLGLPSSASSVSIADSRNNSMVGSEAGLVEGAQSAVKLSDSTEAIQTETVRTDRSVSELSQVHSQAPLDDDLPGVAEKVASTQPKTRKPPPFLTKRSDSFHVTTRKKPDDTVYGGLARISSYSSVSSESSDGIVPGGHALDGSLRLERFNQTTTALSRTASSPAIGPREELEPDQEEQASVARAAAEVARDVLRRSEAERHAHLAPRKQRRRASRKKRSYTFSESEETLNRPVSNFGLAPAEDGQMSEDAEQGSSARSRSKLSNVAGANDSAVRRMAQMEEEIGRLRAQLSEREKSEDEKLFFDELVNFSENSYANGTPVSASIMFQCLLHWNAFSPDDRSGLAGRTADAISVVVRRNKSDPDLLSYWLSNCCCLLHLVKVEIANQQAKTSKKPSNRNSKALAPSPFNSPFGADWNKPFRMSGSASQSGIDKGARTAHQRRPSTGFTFNSVAHLNEEEVGYSPRQREVLYGESTSTPAPLPVALADLATPSPSPAVIGGARDMGGDVLSKSKSSPATGRTSPQLELFDRRLQVIVSETFQLLCEKVFKELRSVLTPALLLQDESEPVVGVTQQGGGVVQDLATAEHMCLILSGFLQLLVENFISSVLMEQFYIQILYHIDASVFNLVLNNPSLCSFGAGLRLKMLVSRMEQWLENTEGGFIAELKDHLSTSRQTADLLLSPKDLLVEKSERQRICPKLNLLQIDVILAQYQKDELDLVGVTPQLSLAINACIPLESIELEDAQVALDPYERLPLSARIDLRYRNWRHVPVPPTLKSRAGFSFLSKT